MAKSPPQVPPAIFQFNRSPTWWLAREAIKYALWGEGFLATTSVPIRMYFRTRLGLETPDATVSMHLHPEGHLPPPFDTAVDFYSFQSGHHVANFLVSVPAAIEVVGPVLKDDRIAGVVGGQHDIGGIGVGAEFFECPRLPVLVRSLSPVLAAVQLDLHEEGLAGLAA